MRRSNYCAPLPTAWNPHTVPRDDERRRCNLCAQQSDGPLDLCLPCRNFAHENRIDVAIVDRRTEPV